MTAHGRDESFGFTILALLNAGSFLGRFLPGIAADYIGRFNVIILTMLLCAISVLAIWLPTGGSMSQTIAFAVIFGFASGSNLGLLPVCISQLCAVERFGRYLSSAFFCASFG